MLSSQRENESPYPKTLASWIALDYFLRVRPLRAWRWWVTLAAMAVSALYGGLTLWPTLRAAHQAGAVSTAHTLFGNECVHCHQNPWQPAVRLVHGDQVRSVGDNACLSCHDGAIHHATTLVTPACANCHREHRGQPVLARVADGYCTDCHKTLKAAHPKTIFANIESFEADHPEFLAARPGQKDDSALHFNHALHLKLNLKTLRCLKTPDLLEVGDKLDCTDCHRPDSDRRYMQPIRYEKHCAVCHPLSVMLTGEFTDQRAKEAVEHFRRIPAPHRRPVEVRAELRERLLRFIQANPVVPATPGVEPPRPLPGRFPRQVSEAETRWVKDQLRLVLEPLFLNRQMPSMERRVFGGKCRQCHIETEPIEQGQGLPEYEPTCVPARWFPHSAFRHDSHRMLDCLSCHAEAATSKLTSDILMPGIESCKKCHSSDGGARTDCAECHLYHNRSQERSFRGTRTIESFRIVKRVNHGQKKENQATSGPAAGP